MNWRDYVAITGYAVLAGSVVAVVYPVRLALFAADWATGKIHDWRFPT